jgi:hypothetical protein
MTDFQDFPPVQHLKFADVYMIIYGINQWFLRFEIAYSAVFKRYIAMFSRDLVYCVSPEVYEVIII